MVITSFIAEQNGFLGTQAGFLSDLLFVSLLVLVPLGLSGFWLGRRHRGAAHRVVMLVAYVVIAVFVLIYVIHNLVEGFPPRHGDTFSFFNLVYLGIGLVHSVLATAALWLGARQLFTGYTFTRITGQWAMKASDRTVHQVAGRRSLLTFFGAAVTGIFFYLWVFVTVPA